MNTDISINIICEENRIMIAIKDKLDGWKKERIQIFESALSIRGIEVDLIHI